MFVMESCGKVIKLMQGWVQGGDGGMHPPTIPELPETHVALMTVTACLVLIFFLAGLSVISSVLVTRSAIQ